MRDAVETETDKTANDEVVKATERAERAEQELARIKGESRQHGQQPTSATGSEHPSAPGDGESELRKDSMMAHLLDSLEAGQDIGHYGRLVFTMTARHFMSQDDLLSWLTRDPDFSEIKARAMLRQVEERGYNPPKRDRILEWQREQEFPILPNPEDPDCGNLYRNLKFPDAVYEHIEEYREKKESSGHDE